MNLKEARKKHGVYTQRELADRVFVSEMTVSNWETGKTVPSDRMKNAIAGILGIPVQDIDFVKK